MSRIDHTIAFLGAGNMASALIEGLLNAGTASPGQLIASDPNEAARARLAERHGMRTTSNSREAVADADIVVLSVKPQTFAQLLPEVHGALAERALIISIAAGIPTSTIEGALGSERRVVRAMPNTPALVQAGATGLSKGRAATDDDLAAARAIFDSVGITVTVPESLIDAVTGLSGSGPAYVFRMVEGLVTGGVQAGLAPDDALKLAAQTVFGAGKLLLQAGEDPAELRRRVTSPGGTTAAGLATLDERGFVDALAACVERATARGKELAQLK